MLLLAFSNTDGFEKTYFDNFNEACDEFYSKKVNTDIKNIKEAAWNKKVKQFGKKIKARKKHLIIFIKQLKLANIKEK